MTSKSSRSRRPAGPARPRGPRWRRRKDARPEEILRAALEVFVTRGFAAARLDEVARRAGVSKGTIYLYFPGKEALFKAVVRQNIVPNIERAEHMVATHEGRAGDALRAIVRGLWEAVGESSLSGIPKLIIAEAANFPDLARFYYTEVASRGIGLLMRIIERGITRGEFRPVDPRYAAMAVLGSGLFAVIWKHSLYPIAGTAFDFRAFIEVHLENCIRGLSRNTDQDGSHA